MQISTVLDHVDSGHMALPQFQRGFVWNRDQVRGLMFSLYKRHPVGSLLVWITKSETAETRGEGDLAAGMVKLLLDGQQRITTLYGIIRGAPPEFFDGNLNAFTDLYFNLESEEFSFYMPTKMKDDPFWINVTHLMRDGISPYVTKLSSIPEVRDNLDLFINRLNAIYTIKEVAIHTDEVTGDDKTVDVVVDIFNRVNSGGTKLSKGDLALARICAEWADARDEMKRRLAKWSDAGFHFKLEWLLRSINTVTTGDALFSALKDVGITSFKEGLLNAEKHSDTLINMIASRLGLDHNRVLGSVYSFPLMVRYIHQRGGRITDRVERDKLLYWYIHTFLWGRYSGSTESKLNQDLGLIEAVTSSDDAGGLDALIDGLRRERGDLKLNANDFLGSTRGARFYPMMYMLSRVCHAKDWDMDVELTYHLLGRLSELQLHHIFPKSALYKYGYKKRDVNAIANFTFLTQETNLKVRDRLPSEYIPEFEARFPGIIATHWIPMDPELWKIENYHKFLEERRRLLAEAGNEFLKTLIAGEVPETEADVSVFDKPAPAVAGSFEDEDEELTLQELNDWVAEQGLPPGELLFELCDEDTGEVQAIFDLAWPRGLQEDLSQRVAILLNEGTEIEDIANHAGYRFFTDVDAFRCYVKKEVLVLDVV